MTSKQKSGKDRLVVLDFDGFLINSYRLLQITFEHFGLDVGDEERFRHRRKFLKYLGGGKEFLRNLVYYSLPRKKNFRRLLTDIYQERGYLYPEFVPLLNSLIAAPDLHVGVISRNYTCNPGLTIRAVLRNSGVDEKDLDFVIPVGVGVKKHAVLEAMRSTRYRECLFGGDEVGDYRAAAESGYESIIMASYGFDNRKRLLNTGQVPDAIIFDTPRQLAGALSRRLNYAGIPEVLSA